ncbi:MAG TPA: glycosyltransferase family 39 protein [Candidatus Acidoferrum sp.]|nr:glycosyltransferase family 39 protein [Candidatus Acidoferrum sp.]
MLDSVALNRVTTSQRRLAVWVGSAVAVTACLFGNLGAIGFLGPDEPRYAWIARAMAESSDWVTPRLYGDPWFEKPVLYYWAAAAGFRLHLSAEWAARLPSAFSALAAAVAIGWLGWKHYAHDVSSLRSPALLGPLVFSTSVAAVGFSRSAAPDMLFSAAIVLAMVSAAGVLERAGALGAVEPGASHADWGPLARFGFFLALGVLAKGPAALALAGGAMGLWAMFTARWRVALRLAHPVAIGVFSIVALPWHVLCAIRNPAFLHVFLFEHNFERYLTPIFHHRQPLWFFGPIVLVALLPWTVLIAPAAWEGLRLWREKSWEDSPGFFLGCWAAFPVLFFSLSQSKLPGYVLPAIPPLALLSSLGAIRIMDDRRFRTHLLFSGIGFAWFLLGVAAWRGMAHLSTDAVENLRATGTIVAIVALVIAVMLVLASFYRPPQVVIGLSVLSVALVVEAISLIALPKLDPLFSARSHAAFMANDKHPDRIFTYHLRRSWDYGLAFYFHRELPEWQPTDPEAALVLTTPEGLVEIEKLGRFRGVLDETYVGVLYVPVQPEPR